MNMKVSILIPIYKSEQFIEQCFRSVLCQTYEDIEYVVVNDATPDSSMDIIARVIDDFPKRKDAILYINNQLNKGIVYNRNLMVQNATGDYVYFVDSDDYLASDSIEKLVHTAQEQNADIVRCNYFEVSDKGIVQKDIYPYKNREDFLHFHLSAWDTIQAMWQMLIKRSLFTDNNLRFMQGTDGCEDYLMTIYLAYYAKKVVDLHSTPLYYYRKNNVNSLTHVNKIRFRNSMCNAAKGAYIFLKEKHIETQYKESVLRRIHLCKQVYLIDKDLFNLDTYYSFFPESNKYWHKMSYPFKQRLLFILAEHHCSLLIRIIKLFES